MQPVRRRSRRNLCAITLALLWSASTAHAELETLPFPKAPAWYFVSLQVEPASRDPLSVFPVGGGFAYSDIWSFDPIDGWRHYAPPSSDLPAELLASVNDLFRIDALHGYWIHVTSVPSESFSLDVEGPVATLQELTDPGWHPIGPLLEPSAAPENLDGVFADIGGALPTAIPEAWRYDRATGAFEEITLPAADCAASPEECLAPTRGYWVRTTTEVTLGREVTLRPSAITLSAQAPFQKLEISYRGAPLPFSAALRADSGPGFFFLPAQEEFIDESTITSVDLTGASPDGPDTQWDPDGDGTPEPCPDLCGSETDCVDLCFQDPTRTHTVYLGVDPSLFTALETYTSPDPGFEYGELRIEVGGVPAGGGSGAGTGSGPQVVASSLVGLSPPTLTGEYAGSLVYGDRQDGSVPIVLLMDDCTEPPGGGVRDCTGDRVTAVINPTLVGSSSNGLDDDDDGDVDELSEEGVVRRVRESSGFSGDVVLHGSISSDNRFLRLEGTAGRLADLDFATAVQCIAGACSDGSGPCSQASDCNSYGNTAQCDAGACTDGSGACSADADCPRHGGIGNLFAGASRRVALQAERTGLASFSGFFVDEYETPVLGDLGGGGELRIERVSAPQCVARDPGATETLPLGIPCREDGDCPLRCANGDPEVAGLSCSDDSDCVVVDETGATKTAFCEPFPCRFLSVGGGSQGAFEHQSVGVSLNVTLQQSGGGEPGEFGAATLEVLGLGVVALATAPGTVDLGALPCGSYQLRASGPNCAPVVQLFDSCGAPPSVDLSCTGPAETPTGIATTSTGDVYTLVGGFPASGPVTFQLEDDVGAPCVPAPGTACTAVWEDGVGAPTPTVLTGGVAPDDFSLLAVAGQPAVAGPDPVTSWTDELAWAPAGLRSGLLALLDELGIPTP